MAAKPRVPNLTNPIDGLHVFIRINLEMKPYSMQDHETLHTVCHGLRCVESSFSELLVSKCNTR